MSDHYPLIQKEIDSFRRLNFQTFITPTAHPPDLRLNVTHGNGRFSGINVNREELAQIAAEITEFLSKG